LNPVLNALRLTQQQGQVIVVDAAGGGDYTDLNTAVAAGHRLIWVRPGTYVLTADLDLTGQKLIGENPGACIIQVPDNFQITLGTHAAANYVDGGGGAVGVQFTNASVNVDGTGTTWDTGATPPSGYTNPWLFSLLKVSEIASVSSDVLALLEAQFRGNTTAAPEAYAMADVASHGSLLMGFTVEHTAGAVIGDLIQIADMGNVVCNNYIKAERTYTQACIRMATATSVAALNIIEDNIFSSGAIGIQLWNAYSNVIRGNHFENQNDHQIEFTAGAANINCQNNRIEGNNFISCGDIPIQADQADADYTQIRGNTFFDQSGDSAIEITANQAFWKIIDNFFLTDGGAGFGLIRNNVGTLDEAIIANNYFAADALNLAGDDIIVKGNRFDGGSNLFDATRMVIEGNIAFGTVAWTVTVANLVFKGNIMDGVGIVVAGVDNHVIVGNNFRNMAVTAIYASAAAGKGVIADNMIANTGGNNGIRVAGDDWTISGNEIQGGVNGIRIDTNSDSIVIDGNVIKLTTGDCIYCETVSWVTISDNHVMPPSGEYGILVNGGTHCSIDGNTCDSSTGTARGIYLLGTAPGENRVCGNIVHDGAHQGILVDTAGSCVVSGNVVSDCAQEGIQIEVDDCVVNGNICRDNGGDGIEINSDLCIIDGNRVENNTGDGIDISNQDRCIVTGNIALNNGAQINQAGATNQVVANNIVA
jgi:parallel beta-helix repeat protein